MFGMIVVVGIKILSTARITHRDTLCIAISVGLSVITSFAPATVFETFPPLVRIIASDGMVVGTLVAVLLNLAMPGDRVRAAERAA
jgi:xanthine/uracil permease